MIKYLWGKNPHWTEVIFGFIDWKPVETCMTKMTKKSGFLVPNTLKLVHGWQNDGQQKADFFRTVRILSILLGAEYRVTYVLYSIQGSSFDNKSPQILPE